MIVLRNPNPFIKLIPLLFALVVCITGFAQTDTGIIKPKSYFRFSTSYLTNAVYAGRRDSVTLPYITPTLFYHNKSGFYLQASLSYLASAGNAQTDAGSLTAGYDFTTTNNKFTGDVYASKQFYNTASTSVKSQVNASVGSYATYDAGLIIIEGGASVYFSSKPDVSVVAGLSHLFILDSRGALSLAPQVLVNAGSQNYYDDYVTKTRFSAKRRKRTGGLINPASVAVIKKDFSVLDYEFSLPVNYDGNKWGLYLTPTYAIPVNPVKYSINGATYRTESLSNSLYAEIGAYLKF